MYQLTLISYRMGLHKCVPLLKFKVHVATYPHFISSFQLHVLKYKLSITAHCGTQDFSHKLTMLFFYEQNM